AMEQAGRRPVTVSDVEELVKRKDEIEAQIKANYELLEGQKGVGMNEPLVDADGFPRDDIDLYKVRTLRHNIICERGGDRREREPRKPGWACGGGVRAELEGPWVACAIAQFCLCAQLKGDAVTCLWRRQVLISSVSVQGLQVNDEIVEFGSVNANNFQSMQNIATVVQHSEERPLSVTVIRSGKKVHVGLTPKRWAGKGLLG
ncbi:PSMD9 ATPase, partial [Piaya cayana]|nr:PSMD9 ATPase [Piaya cayana]